MAVSLASVRDLLKKLAPYAPEGLRDEVAEAIQGMTVIAGLAQPQDKLMGLNRHGYEE